MTSKISVFLKDKVYKDLSTTLIFGILSAILGLIKIDTPGFEGSYSDLREVALLIALFHLRNPLFIIPLTMLTLFGLTIEVKLIPIFIMHAVPLTVVWFLFQKIKRIQKSSVIIGIIWFLTTLIYFTLLLYPILILTYRWFGINENLEFVDSYMALFSSGTLEMTATGIGTSIYLVQVLIRRSLESTNENLEEIVENRTKELTEANSKLQTLNENLERMVEKRTEKINNQLQQMIKYADMNSHEVRAPLARLLGLVDLYNKEMDESTKCDLIKKIDENSQELDQIIRKMNRILEKEL